MSRAQSHAQVALHVHDHVHSLAPQLKRSRNRSETGVLKERSGNRSVANVSSTKTFQITFGKSFRSERFFVSMNVWKIVRCERFFDENVWMNVRKIVPWRTFLHSKRFEERSNMQNAYTRDHFITRNVRSNFNTHTSLWHLH